MSYLFITFFFITYIGWTITIWTNFFTLVSTPFTFTITGTFTFITIRYSSIFTEVFTKCLFGTLFITSISRPTLRATTNTFIVFTRGYSTVFTENIAIFTRITSFYIYKHKYPYFHLFIWRNIHLKALFLSYNKLENNRVIFRYYNHDRSNMVFPVFLPFILY